MSAALAPTCEVVLCPGSQRLEHLHLVVHLRQGATHSTRMFPHAICNAVALMQWISRGRPDRLAASCKQCSLPGNHLQPHTLNPDPPTVCMPHLQAVTAQQTQQLALRHGQQARGVLLPGGGEAAKREATRLAAQRHAAARRRHVEQAEAVAGGHNVQQGSSHQLQGLGGLQGREAGGRAALGVAAGEGGSRDAHCRQ